MRSAVAAPLRGAATIAAVEVAFGLMPM